MDKDIGFKQNETSDHIFPLGVTLTSDGMHFCTVSASGDCSLLLYKKKGQEPIVRIPFPAGNRCGDLVYMTIEGFGWRNYEYAYEIDGKVITDPYGRNFTGGERWGDLSHVKAPKRSGFCIEKFEWEEDRRGNLPFADCVIYHLHVRGFTKHISSNTTDRGTFKAVEEKIPYLQELGINVVEMMPAAEFEEVMFPDEKEGAPYGKSEPSGKINYWGYTPAFPFAPKASYSAGKEKKPEQEFKELVKALHKAGIEIILEFYFDDSMKPMEVMDCLRYWVTEYHVDGFHLLGTINAALISSDPALSKTKLLAQDWNGISCGQKSHLGECNDGYLIDMRKYLKGDEDQINQLIFRTSRNPLHCTAINYITNTNGFTLMDLVSYDRKHNEENGEKNRDGSSGNYSWNCGIEGKTRRNKVLKLRKQQIRNALTMLFLSQGTPLLLAGDEFGNSQNGNNNAYCQDNLVSWIDWRLLEKNQDIFLFVKSLIDFRKKHPVFHLPAPLKVMGHLPCKVPDVSYHGASAWRPDLETYSRQLGILYCGEYADRPDGTKDDYFYVAYNMHWDSYTFAVPNLPKHQKWYLVFDTEKVEENGVCRMDQEILLENQKSYTVSPRSICVLSGK